MRFTSSRSACHFALKELSSSFRSAISLLSISSFCSSPSRFIASRSISNCFSRREISSSSSGTESRSIRSFAAASSIRSMALSGRKRSVIYRFESSTAAIIASSLILTLWWFSYLSFRPRRMDMVLSTSGSLTMTVWKRRSRALSFSKYFWYSSRVVAPMLLSSPRARAGFRILAASIAPSPLPAPTRVCISSIKRIMLPSLLVTSFTTLFNLSSNSPLYFAPAISAPMSSE